MNSTSPGSRDCRFCATPLETTFVGLGMSPDYTVDRNPYKQRKYTPGTHIPIMDPAQIARTKPDYIFVLPWNLRDEITKQMAFVREWGCKFIVPIPEPNFVD